MQPASGASPFAGTAPYYARFRAPYAPAALDWIIATYALDRGGRALDLGCGPGILAIPLAHAASEVVAVDPDLDMLAEGRRAATAGGRTNITWYLSRAEDIPPTLAPFRAVTLGQSFHWMNRDQVLHRLADMVEDGGGLALVNPGKRRPQESWEETAQQVVTRFLGPRHRHPNANPREPAHEPALRRSRCFSAFSTREFPTTVTRDVAAITGQLYSTSGAARPLFGTDALAFEAALSEALLHLNPAGLFAEPIETEIVLAPWKPR